MAFRTQTVTLLPALCFLVLSSCFAFLTFQVVDSSLKQGLLTLSSSLFVAGLVLTLHWVYSWALSKRLRESESGFVFRILSLSHLIGVLLTAFGSITLVWLGHLIWYDITVWGKDISLILFGSRAGESISLGIGMIGLNYFLIGWALLLLGLVILLHGLRKCPHYFGYLASRPKKAPISTKCLNCPLTADCIMMDKRRSS
jgi:hypothetical protein